MEDFLGILVVFVFYLIAAVGSGKQKKKKNAHRPLRSSSQREQTDPGKAARNRKHQRGFAEAFGGRIAEQPVPVPVSVSLADKKVKETAVPQKRIVSVKKDRDTAFDEDSFAVLEEAASSPIYEQEIGREDAKAALAQDVLRGVVMSEVLMRPRERVALQRSRRRI